MKFKKEFLQISATAFVLSLMPNLLLTALFFVGRAFSGIEGFQLRVIISTVISFVIWSVVPVLIFAVFYFIWKRADAPLELRSILFALLIGDFASFFTGSIVYAAIAGGLSIDGFFGFMGASLLSYFAIVFFSALAGISVGHIRRNKLTLKVEKESN